MIPIDAAPILEPPYLRTVARTRHDATTGTMVRFSMWLPEFGFHKPDPQFREAFDKILAELGEAMKTIPTPEV